MQINLRLPTNPKGIQKQNKSPISMFITNFGSFLHWGSWECWSLFSSTYLIIYKVSTSNRKLRTKFYLDTGSDTHHAIHSINMPHHVPLNLSQMKKT